MCSQNTMDYFEYDKGSGIRVLYVGNSVTKHAPKPEIGWTNDCGMAASCTDKDYVHLIQAKVKEIHPDAAFSILQIGNYEREFYYRKPEDYYQKAQDFNADLIIMFFGANVRKDYAITDDPPKTFKKAYEDLRNFLVNGRKPFVLHSQGYYVRPKVDKEKQEVSNKYNDTFVWLEDIRELPETLGKFNHPGDFGMQVIADKFWVEIKDFVENFKK